MSSFFHPHDNKSNISPETTTIKAGIFFSEYNENRAYYNEYGIRQDLVHYENALYACKESFDPEINGKHKPTDSNYWYLVIKGIEGPQGIQGIPGKDGKDGRDGESIKGDRGETGRKGETGKDGKDGRDGKDAIPPKIRINWLTNIWEISTDNGKTWETTGVPATGPKGETGEKGDSIKGDTGEPGIGLEGPRGKTGEPGKDGKDGNKILFGDQDLIEDPLRYVEDAVPGDYFISNINGNIFHYVSCEIPGDEDCARWYYIGTIRNDGTNASVSYMKRQNLTDAQKQLARENIGANEVIDGLATEEYVDNAIANLEIPDLVGAKLIWKDY